MRHTFSQYYNFRKQIFNMFIVLRWSIVLISTSLSKNSNAMTFSIYLLMLNNPQDDTSPSRMAGNLWFGLFWCLYRCVAVSVCVSMQRTNACQSFRAGFWYFHVNEGLPFSARLKRPWINNNASGTRQTTNIKYTTARFNTGNPSFPNFDEEGHQSFLIKQLETQNFSC